MGLFMQTFAMVIAYRKNHKQGEPNSSKVCLFHNHLHQFAISTVYSGGIRTPTEYPVDCFSEGTRYTVLITLGERVNLKA